MTSTIPTPVTLVVGQVVTAANWNAYVRDPTTFFLSPPRYLANQQVPQTVATATAPLLTLDVSEEDTETARASSTSYLVPFSGLWEINAVCNWALTGGAGGTDRILYAYRVPSGAGPLTVATDIRPASVTGPTTCRLVAQRRLVAGDTIQLAGSHTAGVSVATTVLGEGGARLCLRLLNL